MARRAGLGPRHDAEREPATSAALRRRVGHARSDAEEWDRLATALNRWGIIHLAPERPVRRGAPHTAVELFERLALAAEPRLQQAAILLLLTHPELAPEAQSAIGRLAGVARDRAMRRYVASAAMQRMARTRIEMRLGPRPLIPTGYLDELGLPSLDLECGQETLIELACQEEARYGYNAWGTYRALLDLFLAEIRRREWGVPCDSAPTEPA